MLRTSLFPSVCFLAQTVLSRNLAIDYDCKSTPQICLNTCWAVNCVGHPNPLNGGAGVVNAGNNRKAWGYDQGPCGSFGWAWTTPDGLTADSPDEYPLASSYQGGWVYNGKVVSLRCVPLAEQLSQGGKTNGIATSYGPADTITFSWGGINNLPSLGGNPSPNWCTSNPTCNNDGHQFVATAQGDFQLDDISAIVRRDLNVTSHARWEDNGDKMTLKALVGEDGDLIPVPFEA